MKPSCPVIHGKEKENAGEKIKSQGVHITHPMSGEELIGQSPRTNEKEADRREKLGVPIQELIEEIRSEEHTSELQSRGHLVCRLLLEKKKKKRAITISS